MSAYAIYKGSSSKWLEKTEEKWKDIQKKELRRKMLNKTVNEAPCDALSPSFCQSVVAKVKNELMERVWLDLSHLLFLLLHDFHGGFLQESTGSPS